jgi:hydrogenase maturation factor HypE
MLKDVREYVEAAFEQINPARARGMARSMLQGQPSEQVNRMARELVNWSQRTRERITELAQAEVKRQLRAVGVVTRDDLDAVRARVRELEKAGSGSRGSSSGTATGKRSSTKSSTAKRSTRKTSTAKKSTAKTSSQGSTG